MIYFNHRHLPFSHTHTLAKVDDVSDVFVLTDSNNSYVCRRIFNSEMCMLQFVYYNFRASQHLRTSVPVALTFRFAAAGAVFYEFSMF